MKYIKRPVALEAVQLKATESSIKEVLTFMGRMGEPLIARNADRFTDYCNLSIDDGFIRIKTLESDNETQVANFGDYIIRGIQGEFYPCKPDIFKETYCTEQEYAELNK